MKIQRIELPHWAVKSKFILRIQHKPIRDDITISQRIMDLKVNGIKALPNTLDYREHIHQGGTSFQEWYFNDDPPKNLDLLLKLSDNVHAEVFQIDSVDAIE